LTFSPNRHDSTYDNNRLGSTFGQTDLV